MIYLIYYILFISTITVLITGYDKFASKRRKRKRVPETFLLIISALGGSAAMLFTMLIIHHKTHHKKFMIGVPIILLIQTAVIITYQKML